LVVIGRCGGQQHEETDDKEKSPLEKENGPDSHRALACEDLFDIRKRRPDGENNHMISDFDTRIASGNDKFITSNDGPDKSILGEFDFREGRHSQTTLGFHHTFNHSSLPAFQNINEVQQVEAARKQNPYHAYSCPSEKRDSTL